MGTRGLTMVISEGKTKVAQYGQWDHYPSGQGVTVFNFLKNADLNIFKQQLNKCRFMNDEDNEKKIQFFERIGAHNGWMNGEQAEMFHAEYPFQTRDHGAEILNLIYYTIRDEVLLVDGTNFAADSLFCEWAYVVDLDKKVLEVYTGFNKKNVGKTNRFAYLSDKTESGYKVIRLLTKIKFKDLPETNEQFIEMVESKLPKSKRD